MEIFKGKNHIDVLSNGIIYPFLSIIINIYHAIHYNRVQRKILIKEIANSRFGQFHNIDIIGNKERIQYQMGVIIWVKRIRKQR